MLQAEVSPLAEVCRPADGKPPRLLSTKFILFTKPCRNERINADRRRQFLENWGGGLGWIALAQLLGNEAGSAQASASDGLHHPAKAKRVVQLFMSGAASQCDMFDYKPLLIERNGQPFDPGGEVELFQSSPGPVMQSPWDWKQHGESGKWMSSLVPHLGGCVDQMAFFPSMVSKSNVHGPATFMQNSGFVLPGFPSMGAWISYGLGTLTEELPSFVVLPDARGFAPNGPGNHSAGFLPAQHQGTMIRAGRQNPIHDLFPPASADFVTPESEKEGLALLERLNRQHLASRSGDSRLEARIQAYEMAARRKCGRSAGHLGESGATKSYGLDESTRNLDALLTARRSERGALRTGSRGRHASSPHWDSHEIRKPGADGTEMDNRPPHSSRLERAGFEDDVTDTICDARSRDPSAATTTRSHLPRG